MVNIKILAVNENILLHRKEIDFEIDHLGQGTPNRLEVREKIAALQTTDSALVFIHSMKPRFGITQAHGKAFVYENEESAQKLEPIYFRIRNQPKDQRDALWKEARSKKKKKKGKGAK